MENGFYSVKIELVLLILSLHRVALCFTVLLLLLLLLLYFNGQSPNVHLFVCAAPTSL